MKKVCKACGASMMEHRHSLSEDMLRGLLKIANAEVAINIKNLNLSRNQWDNFQKLRYWGLVAKAYDPTGKRIGGYWKVTFHGLEFAKGKIAIPRVVWTYRGEFVRYEGESVYFSEVKTKSKTRPEYAEEARPHQ